jgi:lysophospholipase L1-like esterase
MEGLSGRLGLLALGCLASVVGAEAVLRCAGPRPGSDRRDLHQARPDRPWLYGMRPGAEASFPETGDVRYRVNRDGFRDADFSRPKPQGSFRVLVLGDSVAFGYGVALEQTFPEQLERLLGARVATPRIEVLNLAVSGYNPYTEAALLDDVGLGLEPDLVLVQFCSNDLADPTLHFDVHTRVHVGAIPDAAFPDPEQRRGAAWRSRRALEACHRLRLCALLDDALLAALTPEPDEATQRAAVSAPGGGPGPEWSWIEALYARMARASRERGAAFGLLAFPYAAQLDETYPHPVQERLLELGRRGGYPVLDLLPAFHAARSKGAELFLDWWHPSAPGHALAARVLAAGLACQGLLPPSASALCSESR